MSRSAGAGAGAGAGAALSCDMGGAWDPTGVTVTVYAKKTYKRQLTFDMTSGNRSLPTETTRRYSRGTEQLRYETGDCIEGFCYSCVHAEIWRSAAEILGSLR